MDSSYRWYQGIPLPKFHRNSHHFLPYHILLDTKTMYHTRMRYVMREEPELTNPRDMALTATSKWTSLLHPRPSQCHQRLQKLIVEEALCVYNVCIIMCGLPHYTPAPPLCWILTHLVAPGPALSLFPTESSMLELKAVLEPHPCCLVCRIVTLRWTIICSFCRQRGCSLTAAVLTRKLSLQANSC